MQPHQQLEHQNVHPDFYEMPEQISFEDSSYDENNSLLKSIAEVATICSSPTCTLPGMYNGLEKNSAGSPQTSTCSTPSRQVDTPLQTTVIPAAMRDELYKKSSFVSNFAKNLVFEMFNTEELKESNCAGTQGKKSLEKDPRMESIKEMTFKKFPKEDKKKSWCLCRKAIDSAIRKLRFQS